MKTSDQRIRVVNHGRENWRTEVQDEPGADWAITGPPYPTMAEALLNTQRVAAEYFGEAPPGAEERIAAALAIGREFGGIDGDHHKAWVIERMTAALEGRPADVSRGIAP